MSLVISSLALTPIVHAGPLINPGFESGSANWSLPTGASITTAAGEFQSGTRALKLTAAGAATQDLGVELLPGLFAKVTGYIKTGTLNAGVNARMVVRHSFPSPTPYQDVLIGEQTVSNRGYYLYSKRIYVPVGVSSSIVRLEVAGGGGTAFFDSCNVEIVSGKQLVANRDFESSAH